MSVFRESTYSLLISQVGLYVNRRHPWKSFHVTAFVGTFTVVIESDNPQPWTRPQWGLDFRDLDDMNTALMDFEVGRHPIELTEHRAASGQFKFMASCLECDTSSPPLPSAGLATCWANGHRSKTGVELKAQRTIDEREKAGK